MAWPGLCALPALAQSRMSVCLSVCLLEEEEEKEEEEESWWGFTCNHTGLTRLDSRIQMLY